MDNPTKIQIAVGVALLAAGVALAFTLQGDAPRLAGAVIATLGVIMARRAFRAMRRR